MTKRDDEVRRALLVDMFGRALDYFQSAYRADPAALDTLLAHRVPCNEDLANHPAVVCDVDPETLERTVGPLGLVCGLMSAMGLPLVAGVYEGSGESGDVLHSPRLLGFAAYNQVGSKR